MAPSREGVRRHRVKQIKADSFIQQWGEPYIPLLPARRLCSDPLILHSPPHWLGTIKTSDSRLLLSPWAALHGLPSLTGHDQDLWQLGPRAESRLAHLSVLQAFSFYTQRVSSSIPSESHPSVVRLMGIKVCQMCCGIRYMMGRVNSMRLMS